MKRIANLVVNVVLIISLLLPFNVVNGIMVVATAGNYEISTESSGLFRTEVEIRQEYDLTRLKEMELLILSENEDSAVVLVSSSQLETLARLGFRPQASEDLNILVAASAESTPWLAQGLQASLQQATASFQATGNSINQTEDVEKDLVEVLSGFSIEQQNGILALPGVDSDADGLTDTQESWWCTDSMNPDSDGDGKTDGTEILAIKNWMDNRSVQAPGETPWATWPFDPTACPDKDFDSIPNLVEKYELGLNMDLESTDRDRYDDGQEVFGVTYCPGSGSGCGYGILPAANHDDVLLFPQMPSWVQFPGNHPAVAAYPKLEFQVVDDEDGNSFRIQAATTITTEVITNEGETKLYSTTKLDGTSTTNDETTSIENFEEYSETTELYTNSIEENEILATIVSNRLQTTNIQTSRTNNTFVSVTNNPQSKKVNPGTKYLEDKSFAILDFAYKEVDKELGITKYAGSAIGATAKTLKDAFTGRDDWSKILKKNNCSETDTSFSAMGCRLKSLGTMWNNNYNDRLDAATLAEQEEKNMLSGDSIIGNGDELGFSSLFPVTYPVPSFTPTKTTTSGTINGRSQTVSHGQYEEHSVTEGTQKQFSTSWANATAVDTVHAADLWFAYTVTNIGSDYARSICNVAINIYIGDEIIPAATYLPGRDIGGDGCFVNFEPGEGHTYSSNTSKRIELTLDQLKAIDLGEPVRFVFEDYSLGQDDYYISDSVGANLTLSLNDGIEDGDDTYETYLLSVMAGDSAFDTISRFFPVEVDDYGMMIAIWTPETTTESIDWCGSPIIVGNKMWCKHAISATEWWSVFTDGMNYGEESYQQATTIPGSLMIWRFNQDSDHDGYSDSSEDLFGTEKINPLSHPNPELIGGVHSRRDGNIIVSTLSLLNLGLYDAYGIEAVMFAPDDTISITENTVGGAGRVRSTRSVIVGSQIYEPNLIEWTGTAKPISQGYFSGITDVEYSFTVTCPITTGCIIGEGEVNIEWNNSMGENGILGFGSNYFTPSLQSIGDLGLQIGINSGKVINGDQFSVLAKSPSDTFTYIVNSEPYTPPIVQVSYNDPQGKHIFYIPQESMELSSPTQDLSEFSGLMVDNETITMPSTEEVGIGSNQTSVFFNNPLDTIFYNGFVVLDFVDATGEVVYETSVKTNFYPGPNTINVNWNTDDFLPAYISGNDYLILAFLTDWQGNIIDVLGRPLSSFDADPLPLVGTSLPGNVWDFGEVQKGMSAETEIAIVNTGYSKLYISIQERPSLDLFLEPQLAIIPAGGAYFLPLTVNTSDVPVGYYQGSITIRTNDPINPTLAIEVVGTVTTTTDSATSLSNPYLPLEEVIYVHGPIEENTKLNYLNSTLLSNDSIPMYFSDAFGVTKGRGEEFLTLDPGAFTINGTQSFALSDRMIQDQINLTGATELEEYRTETSRIYVWPDGRGVVLMANDLAGENSPNDQTQVGVRYDTYVNATYPNTATWNQKLLWLGYDPNNYKSKAHILIWFNLPTLPSYAVVDSAYVKLNGNSWYGSGEISTQVFRITESWTQGNYEPTWNDHPATDWGTVWNSTTFTKNSDYKTWNVTNLVGAWYGGTPNYGMVIRANPENANGMSFCAQENLSDVPILTINFHIPPPPSAPTLYAISNADADGNYAVDWSDVANTTHYELQENLNGGAFGTLYTGAASTYNAVNRGVGYRCYRVRAINAYGSSAYSGTQCTTVNPAPGIPVISPIDNSDGNGNYTISWTSVDYATSYELQESYDSGTYSSIYNGPNLNFTATGRTVGQWCYMVRAINASGTGAWSVPQCVVVNTPPNPPVSLAPANGTHILGRSITFTWVNGGDNDGYPGTPIQYLVEITPITGGAPIESPVLDDTQWIGTVPADGEYLWHVKAYDGRSWSDWSVEHSLGVYSIARTDATHTEIAIPENVDEFTHYRVAHGINANFPAADVPQLLELQLPKRIYTSVTLDMLVMTAVQGNVNFSIDIGNDGSVEWSQALTWTEPASFESPNLAQVINAYMLQSPQSGGEIVTFPVSVNLSTPGDLYLYNLVGLTGIDSDPMIGVGDISFGNSNPIETENLTITAQVHNVGIFMARNTMANFYVGDPDVGGKYIGSKLITNIPGNSYVNASIQWNTSSYTGEQAIYVILDRAGQVSEMDENNNSTSVEIYILTRPDLFSDNLNLSDSEPVLNGTVTIGISLINEGEADSAESIVMVYDGEKTQGGTLIGEGTAEVIGKSSTLLTFTWTPESMGLHRLYVYTDIDDEINEYDESNNLSWMDVYVGVAGPLRLDSGTAADPMYVPELGHGYVDINQPDELVSCGTQPEHSMRRDPDGEVVYQFDHLLPGHFYHLDITLYECDGAGRQESIYFDDNLITGPIDLGDGQVHRLSLRVDPALYADREMKVSIKADGIDGAVVSEVNLFDIDYRYADAGGGNDPQYPGDHGYGWLDGSAVTAWGTLPYQSVRVDQTDAELRYRFDDLDPDKRYNVHLTFWQPSGTGRIMKVQVDGIDTELVINTGDYLRHQESITIPLVAYSSDGSAIISIIRTNASTGAMVNEIALEEETISTSSGCTVQETPYFTETYGEVLIETLNAPIGSIVEAISPRGNTVGCFTVHTEGDYGFMRIYGEDTTATPAIPGMRAGEIVIYKVNGAPAVATPTIYWEDDHASHLVNLNAGATSGQSILLQAGWNLISFNVEPTTASVPLVLQSISGRYDRVLGEVGVYVPTLPDDFNTLRELHSTNGYYIRVNGTTSVSALIEGIQQPCDNPKALHAGWNWIGGPCQPTPTAVALSSIEGYYQRVLSLNKTYDPALPDYSTLLNLIPGEGYLIFITEPVSLVYPIGTQQVIDEPAITSQVCSTVHETPFTSMIYGEIEWIGHSAPEGSVVEILTPRGEVAGCALTGKGGLLPITQIYGADGDGISGFIDGELMTFRVNGLESLTVPDIYWHDDRSIQHVHLTISGYQIFIPLMFK